MRVSDASAGEIREAREKKVTATERRRRHFTRQNRGPRERAIGRSRGRCAPDKLAKENFLVGVEGLRSGEG